MLFASCNSQTRPQEKVATNLHESVPESPQEDTDKAATLAKIEAKYSLTEAANAKATDPDQIPGAGVALAFMNSYVVYCNEWGASSVIAWVERSQHVTQNFKTALKSLHEEARKDDPELGLGFDPIFDAQDYPDWGFNLLEHDKNGYLTLQRKNRPGFTVLVKVKQEGNG